MLGQRGGTHRSGDRKEAPLAGEALEAMDSALAKVETGAGDEILHRARHHDLARSGLRHHARAGVNGDAGDCVIDALALAGVDAGADLEAEASQGVTDAHGAADGAGRAVEGREEAVAGGAYLSPAVTRDLLADGRVVALEKIAPGAVTERDRSLGRADYVGEEDGCQACRRESRG
jgi:hypothetical protein